MTRRDASEAASAARGGWIETALLFALLCLIPIRAVISETQTFEVPRSIRTLDAPAGPSPATTFFIDAFIFAAAGLTFAIQFWKGRAYRKTGAEWGLAILLIAMVVSTLRAGQKHLAIIGSLDFAAIVLYCIALRQLLTRPWHLRLALTVILATGGMMIAKCAYQKWVEQPETLKYYLEHKGELLAANQASPGYVYDYEQRLKSGAVTGFFPHPNVLASYLLLIIMAALAVVRTRWKARPAWTLVIPSIVALSGFAALVGAQSKGAIAALGIGLLFWAAARVFRYRISARKAVIGVWCLLLAGSAAFAGVLHAKPEALGRSILFRTFYWKAAGRMIHDHALGVGANNFGRWFTRYKDVECPEDVEDPHSWPVRAAAEWGIPGLVGMLVLFVGISWQLAKNSIRAGIASASSSENARDFVMGSKQLTRIDQALKSPSIIVTSAGIALVVFVFWYATLSDASGAFILLTFHVPMIAWFVVFVLGGFESTDAPHFSDASLPALTPPLVAGLIAFLIHTGIDLAMFTSAPATLFFAVIATTIAAKWLPNSESETMRSGSSLCNSKRVAAGVTASLLAVSSVSLLLGVMNSIAAIHLQTARRRPDHYKSFHTSSCRECDALENAAFLTPCDGTAINDRIEHLLPLVARADEVPYLLGLIKDFADRDPQNGLVPQYRAMLCLRRYEITRSAASQASSPKPGALTDLDSAITAAREAVAAYPTNPLRRLFLADLLEKRGAASNDAAERKQFNSDAAAELQNALDLDAKRIYVSPLHRMDKMIRSNLGARLEHLRNEP